jgi:hypothetical protein
MIGDIDFQLVLEVYEHEYKTIYILFGLTRK